MCGRTRGDSQGPGSLQPHFQGVRLCGQGTRGGTGDAGTCLGEGPDSVPCAMVGVKSVLRGPTRARRRSHPHPAHLRPAGAEGCAIDDAALFLGPGLAIRVGSAGVPGGQSIRAGWGEFPAVAKLQHVAHHGLAPRGEVVESIVVKVPAQPADPPLQGQHRAHGAVPGRDTEPGPEARLQATPLPQAAPSKLSGRRATQGVLKGAGCQVARCLLPPQSLSPVGMERLSAGTREPRAPPPRD